MDVIENGGTAEDAAAALCEESVDRAVSGPGEQASCVLRLALCEWRVAIASLVLTLICCAQITKRVRCTCPRSADSCTVEQAVAVILCLVVLSACQMTDVVFLLMSADNTSAVVFIFSHVGTDLT